MRPRDPWLGAFDVFQFVLGLYLMVFPCFLPNIVEDVAILNITARGDYSVVNSSATLMMLPT